MSKNKLLSEFVIFGICLFGIEFKISIREKLSFKKEDNQ